MTHDGPARSSLRAGFFFIDLRDARHNAVYKKGLRYFSPLFQSKFLIFGCFEGNFLKYFTRRMRCGSRFLNLYLRLKRPKRGLERFLKTWRWKIQKWSILNCFFQTRCFFKQGIINDEG